MTVMDKMSSYEEGGWMEGGARELRVNNGTPPECKCKQSTHSTVHDGRHLQPAPHRVFGLNNCAHYTALCIIASKDANETAYIIEFPKTLSKFCLAVVNREHLRTAHN